MQSLRILFGFLVLLGALLLLGCGGAGYGGGDGDGDGGGNGSGAGLARAAFKAMPEPDLDFTVFLPIVGNVQSPNSATDNLVDLVKDEYNLAMWQPYWEAVRAAVASDARSLSGEKYVVETLVFNVITRLTITPGASANTFTFTVQKIVKDISGDEISQMLVMSGTLTAATSAGGDLAMTLAPAVTGNPTITYRREANLSRYVTTFMTSQYRIDETQQYDNTGTITDAECELREKQGNSGLVLVRRLFFANDNTLSPTIAPNIRYVSLVYDAQDGDALRDNLYAEMYVDMAHKGLIKKYNAVTKTWIQYAIN